MVFSHASFRECERQKAKESHPQHSARWRSCAAISACVAGLFPASVRWWRPGLRRAADRPGRAERAGADRPGSRGERSLVWTSRRACRDYRIRSLRNVHTAGPGVWAPTSWRAQHVHDGRHQQHSHHRGIHQPIRPRCNPLSDSTFAHRNYRRTRSVRDWHSQHVGGSRECRR